MTDARNLAARAMDLANQCLEDCTRDLVAVSAGDHEALIAAGHIVQVGNPDEHGAGRLVEQLALTLLSATFDANFEETVEHERAHAIA